MCNTVITFDDDGDDVEEKWILKLTSGSYLACDL